MKTNPITTFYVDAAFNHHTGTGGYAVIPVNRRGGVEVAQVFATGACAISSVALELQAVITAMRRAPASLPVTIYSDCCMIADVAARGSIKRTGAITQLWQTFLQLLKQKANVTIRWVRGHAEDRLNNLADREAKRAAKAYAKSIADNAIAHARHSTAVMGSSRSGRTTDCFECVA
ncbi:RNase H family protein [Noviherbaspirillum pedocola]|uniref:Reverse transcriptase-like protein n=1 Tax=Noviherbaspirillum pedocola TaxID=2801341 RepID=A0A934T1U1_9BURK|nr:RNase H family protein [Noviherbaspirillum pedocola]MBK4736103.1 reverse transcriptase-like protein [Noviherbaspirillum pedocola]